MTRKEKRKNTNKKRKLFLAILMIVFTGVILTASTYAWFTANQTVTVESIDVNVAATNGLQLSNDGINWKTIISNDDIINASNTYAAAKNQLPTESNSIVPVSTIGTVDSDGLMEMYAGEIKSNEKGAYILTANKSTEQNRTSGDFVAFDLFFQISGQNDSQIYLTSNSNVKADGTSKGIENAARVAFLPEGNVTAGSATSEIQALKTTVNDDLLIWEPNYDVHTAAAVKNASDTYGITTTMTNGAKLSYNGVKAPITEDDKEDEDTTTAGILLNSTNANFFAPVTPNIYSTSAGILPTAYESVFTLKPGITKVRFYMWVEGQDVDCENNASGSSLIYNLQFSLLDQS